MRPLLPPSPTQIARALLPLAMVGTSFFSCPGSSFDAASGEPVKDAKHDNTWISRKRTLFDPRRILIKCLTRKAYNSTARVFTTINLLIAECAVRASYGKEAEKIGTHLAKKCPDGSTMSKEM